MVAPRAPGVPPFGPPPGGGGDGEASAGAFAADTAGNHGHPAAAPFAPPDPGAAGSRGGGDVAFGLVQDGFDDYA
eukprot:1775133-Lingulodinium_polyedra.AAC.1